ncbi:hypothetical protein MMC25_005681 [Agyrium rufum]|nr:hypothetical protein [Agyrium rufum]
MADEPSVLEWARFYSLCVDHCEEDPLSFEISHLSQPLIFEDTSSLAELNANTIPTEKIHLDKSTVHILSSITKPEIFDTFQCIPTRRPIHDAYAELPLLRTHHASDVTRFRKYFATNLRKERFPTEKLDREGDEGVDWPARYIDYHVEAERWVKSSRLSTSLATAKFMSTTLAKVQRSDVDGIAKDANHRGRSKQRIAEPLTPPLPPLSPVIMPYIPSSEVGHFDLLSDHTTPTKSEVQAIDEAIMRADTKDMMHKPPLEPHRNEAASSDTDSAAHLHTPLKAIVVHPSTPLRKPIKREDLRVEEPLPLPFDPASTLSSFRKKVSFANDLAEFIPDLPPFAERPSDLPPSTDPATFVTETFASAAEKEERKIEQAQLIEADATMRVQVPVMDFSNENLPWDSKGSKFKQVELLNNLESEIDVKRSHWPIDGKMEMSLPWAPFPAALARVATFERIPQSSHLDKNLARPERIGLDVLFYKTDSNYFSAECKADAEPDGDKEIGKGAFHSPHGFRGLLKRKALDISDGNTRKTRVTNKTMGQFHNLGVQQDIRNLSDRTETLTTIDTIVSYQSQYLSARIGRPPLLLNDVKESDHFKSAPSLQNAEVNKTRSEVVPKPSQAFGHHNESRSQLPSLPDMVESRTVIASTQTLSVKKLWQAVASLFPSLRIIERDFAAVMPDILVGSKPSHRASRGSQTKTPWQNDADIILSPGIGLIHTTLQMIEQRNLPGSGAAASPFLERLTRTSPKYEKLVILITPSPVSISPIVLSPSSANELAEVTAFCARLNPMHLVRFIPSPEISDLAHWIVSLVIQHNPANRQKSLKSGQGLNSSVLLSSNELIEEETTWEIFLRQAGMNPFAAQYIFLSLKPPPLDPRQREFDVSRGDYGLPAFVKMTQKERLRRFGPVFGGENMLNRVGEVLAMRWKQV